MRAILFLIGLLFIININLTQSKEIKSYKDVKTIEEYRYINFLLSGKNEIIPNDNDSRLEGEEFIYLRKQRLKNQPKLKIQQKIKQDKQQPTKFKSTYLDFTIIQEENIS